jgi:hypothetical protein
MKHGNTFIDLTGKKIGRLTVKGLSHKNIRGEWYWNCVCVCGKKIKVWGGNLGRERATQSCGCLQHERTMEANTKHGATLNGIKKPEYTIWTAMKARCYCKTVKGYKNYGGRGIRVCGRWLNSFDNFLADMGSRPKGMWIERDNNDGDYTPENCRWATREEQQNNRRDSVRIKYGGDTKTLAQWAVDLGFNYKTLQLRVKRWPLIRAFTEPLHRECSPLGYSPNGRRVYSYKLSA